MLSHNPQAPRTRAPTNAAALEEPTREAAFFVLAFVGELVAAVPFPVIVAVGDVPFAGEVGAKLWVGV